MVRAFIGGEFHDIWSSPKRPPIIDPLLTSKDQPALTEIPSPEFPLREFQNGWRQITFSEGQIIYCQGMKKTTLTFQQLVVTVVLRQHRNNDKIFYNLTLLFGKFYHKILSWKIYQDFSYSPSFFALMSKLGSCFKN